MRLYVFDMDGTLLPATTGMLEIAKITKQQDLLLELEKRYFEKQLSCVEFARAIFEMWQELTPCVVKEAFESSPKLANIRQVVARIADCGGVSCIITSAPDFFANHFFDFGFNRIYASRPFALQSDVFTPEHVLHAADKSRLARSLCKELGLKYEDTVAFGDSHSDAHLFDELTHTISVNGTEYINHLAKHHYKGFDLLEAFSIVSTKIQCVC